MVRLFPIGVALCASTLSAFVPATAQQPPMDDVLWVSSSNSILSADRFGRVVSRVGAGAISVHRAPDGTVWTLDNAGGFQRRDRHGTVLRSVATAGAVRALVFDVSGDAWVGIDSPPTLLRYSPSAVLISRTPLSGSVVDLDVDASGRVWAVQANSISTQITIVDPVAGTSSGFGLPSAFGIAKDVETTPYGTAWIGSSTTPLLIEIDANQVVHRTVQLDVADIGPIALRSSGEAWVVAAGSLYRVDAAPGSFERVSPPAFQVDDVTLDALGGLWVADRGSLLRFDPDRRVAEVAVPVATTMRVQHAAGYHRALVVARNADDDGDGLPNAAELQFGTNPYDAQSSAIASLRSDRLMWRPTDRATFEVRGVGGQGVLLFALRTLATPTPIPGLSGALRLDPGFTIPVALRTTVPGPVSFVVPNDTRLDGSTLFVQALCGLVAPTLTEVAAARIQVPAPQVLVETFQSEAWLDRDRSAGSWSGGIATPGSIGGGGMLGDFDHRLGQEIEPNTFLWNTDDMRIPGSHTMSGQPIRVTDGRFEFASFTLPAGVTVRFVGSHPATILVSGTCVVAGVLDLDGAFVTGTHNGMNAFVVGGVVRPGPGQAGGAPGAGGGRGGAGAWTCDGTGNPNQPQFHDFAGYDGEDIQVVAGHAYAANVVGTGGHGGSLFPAHGDSSLLIYRAFGSVFAVEAAAGGGGGGSRSAGSSGVCVTAGAIMGTPPFPNTTPTERGPSSPGGLAFALLPIPVGTSSLDHFRVGGSGGGGGGSHPLFAQSSASDPVKYRSGGAGAGGGGALALRVGHRLDIASGAVVHSRGGSAESTGRALTISSRGLPAPGGAGSGGSILLQVGGAVAQNGVLDVRGGAGSQTVITGFFDCDVRGGDGGDGVLRLEVPQVNPPLTLLGSTSPSPSTGDVDTLRDRDVTVMQLSLFQPLNSVGTATELLHYELDVRIGGITQTFTDDPVRFRPANLPGLPVRIRFQAMDGLTGAIGPWRDLVTERMPGLGGIAGDHPTQYRFQLVFDRSAAPDAIVDELRVFGR